MPIVYILTNEAMPNLIKIGHTADNNLEARIKQLDTTSVPLPFECHYAVRVDDAFAIEKLLHEGLDKCRIRDRREFFEADPGEAMALLKIATIMGGVEVTPSGPVLQEESDARALEKAHKKRQIFNFEILGIEPGTKLQFKKDETIECEVVNDRQISFRGEIMSLSAGANIIVEEMGYDWGGSVQGPAFWCWRGETLHEHRIKLEERK